MNQQRAATPNGGAGASIETPLWGPPGAGVKAPERIVASNPFNTQALDAGSFG